MTYETLDLRREGAVLWCTLNRPDAFNALNLGLGRDLFDVVLEVDEDPDVRGASDLPDRQPDVLSERRPASRRSKCEQMRTRT